MKPFFVPSLLLPLLAAACADPGTLVLTEGRRLKVEGSEAEGTRWYVSTGGAFRPLPPPPIALHPIAFAPSPDGRFLAVVSVGEGHPVLELLSVPRLLAGTHGDRPLWSIDPYPGFIDLKGWKMGRLVVESDRPLAAGLDEQGRVRSSEVWDRLQAMELDPETGRVAPR